LSGIISVHFDILGKKPEKVKIKGAGASVGHFASEGGASAPDWGFAEPEPPEQGGILSK
jgi:hypothetical protein